MDRIYVRLQELGIEDDQLPETIQKQIDELDEQVKAFNDKIEYLESKEMSQDEIDEATADDDERIEAYEDSILEKINEHHAQIEAANQPKKEKSGYGWLVFGGLALVLTLGAVNVMQKN